MKKNKKDKKYNKKKGGFSLFSSNYFYPSAITLNGLSYLSWNNIPIGTLVILTIEDNSIWIVVSDPLTNSDPITYNDPRFGPKYTLININDNTLKRRFTSYDFRILVVMYGATYYNSDKRIDNEFFYGIISGISKDTQNLCITSIANNVAGHLIFNIYNKSIDSAIIDNNVRIMTIYDINEAEIRTRISLENFRERIIGHPHEDKILNLKITINDKWEISNITNSLQLPSVDAFGGPNQSSFGTRAFGGPAFDGTFGASRESSPIDELPPFGHSAFFDGTFGASRESSPINEQQPFGTGAFRGPSPPPFGQGRGAFEGSPPPPFGQGRGAFRGPSPPPFGQGRGAFEGSPPPPFGQGRGAFRGPSPPPFGQGRGAFEGSPPPPFGQGRGAFEGSPPQSKSKKSSINYIEIAANIIIKYYFNKAKYLTTADFNNLSENPAMFAIIMKNKIMGNKEYEDKDFKILDRKAIRALHPNKFDKTLIYNNVINEENKKNITDEIFGKAVDIVVNLLNDIRNPKTTTSGDANPPPQREPSPQRKPSSPPQRKPSSPPQRKPSSPPQRKPSSPPQRKPSSHPNTKSSINDEEVAINIIIINFFNDSKDITAEYLFKLFNEPNIYAEVAQEKIMGNKRVDQEAYKKLFKKAIIKLHPDRSVENIEFFHKIINEENKKNITRENIREAIDKVYRLLTAIQKHKSTKSGGKSLLYKKVYKKEILGISRVIYKISGSNKEYVKNKGIYILAKEYKNSKK